MKGLGNIIFLIIQLKPLSKLNLNKKKSYINIEHQSLIGTITHYVKARINLLVEVT